MSEVSVVLESRDLGLARDIAYQSKSGIWMPSLANRLRRRAIAAVMSRETRWKHLIVGDSTSAGHKSGTGAANNTGARLNCPYAFMRDRLIAAGIPARSDAFWGMSNFPGNNVQDYAAFNGLLTIGANWTRINGGAFGGEMFQSASPNTDAFIFPPQRAADSFDIYYLRNTGLGTMTVTDASGTLATIDTSGTLSYVKTTVTRALASTSPISIQRSAGGSIQLSGIDPWNSTVPEFCILNAAAIGYSTASWLTASNVYSPFNALATVAAQSAFINLGLNDKNTSVAAGIYKANLQSLVTRLQSISGANSVSLIVPNPATVGNGYELDDAYISSILDVAGANGLASINLRESFVSKATDESLYYDQVHLRAPGSALIGSHLSDYFLA